MTTSTPLMSPAGVDVEAPAIDAMLHQSNGERSETHARDGAPIADDQRNVPAAPRDIRALFEDVYHADRLTAEPESSHRPRTLRPPADASRDSAVPLTESIAPPSCEPVSTPLRWVSESASISEIPESSPLAETGPLTVRRNTWLPPRVLSQRRFGSIDPVSPAPATARESTPPSSKMPDSLLPESAPLSWVAESAMLSDVPESTPMGAPRGQSSWEWSSDPDAQIAVARDMLDIVFARRRLSSPSTCGPRCEECYAPHIQRALGFVRRGKPLHFVLPAFPAKSPNPKKVLGHLPDTAERVALTFLHNLCVNIQKIYRPGARVTICSDGRVFSDLVEVPDPHVTAYRDGLGKILGMLGTTTLDTYNLEDEFGVIGYDNMRKELVDSYAKPLEEVRSQVAGGGPLLSMFNGQARFLFDDMVGMNPSMSRSQARKVTKERAYHMILRSDAWGSLVARKFPDALRLSIHPQPSHNAKIGIHLLQTFDNWLTPWHATAVRAEGRFYLLKRYHAERMGARLVYDGEHPTHFVADSIDLEQIRLSGR